MFWRTHQWSHWSLILVSREFLLLFFYYTLYFTSSDQLVLFFFFFLVLVGYVSRNLSISSRLINLLAIFSYGSLYFYFISYYFCGNISPLSFLILFMWVVSLFLLVSLARGLPIQFILSKKQFLVFVEFFYSFLISIFVYFISDLYFFFWLVCVCVCVCVCAHSGMFDSLWPHRL